MRLGTAAPAAPVVAAASVLATMVVAASAIALAGAPAASARDVPTLRLAGPDRVATAAAASREGWGHARTAVLATAEDFADALAATALAARADAPLLLTWPEALPPATQDELERLDVDEVVILGGEAAVSARVADRVARLPSRPSVRRIGGPDRFATAAAAAADGRASASEAIVASGVAFADAVAAGGLAALGEHPPVLLSRPAALHAASRGALQDLGVERGLIAGGPAALSDAVADDVADAGATPRRLAGADRYATSVALVAEALRRVDAAPRPLVVSTGAGFPDALAAGALAARLEGVLLVVPPHGLPDATDAFVREHRARFAQVLVVGGTAAVGAHVAEELAAAVAGEPRPFATVTTRAGFRGTAAPLPAAVREHMTGRSWRPGCPVGLDDLALLRVRHRTLEGEDTDGELVVAARVAAEFLDAFAAAYDSGFPIARMERVDVYGADDDASMAANNTSAFNCRTVAGTTRWSEHAHGTAIDVNPIQNPDVQGDAVHPPAGRAYLDRSDIRPGMLVEGDAVVAAFDRLGWGWGGRWRTRRDYMHLSESGH